MVTVWVLVLIMTRASGTASVTIDHATRESCVRASSFAIRQAFVSAAYCVPADRRR